MIFLCFPIASSKIRGKKLTNSQADSWMLKSSGPQDGGELVVSIYIASLDVVLRGCGWHVAARSKEIPHTPKNDRATIFPKELSVQLLQHNSFCEFVSFLPLISENSIGKC
jgi:hypothetical protein